ncbi:hypothetical protein AB205_0110140, partial [Aquarana catesbeiana]
MDPEMYQEILNYKLNKCPSGITNSAKYTIRRRAIQFEIKECQECQKEGTEIKAKPEHQPIN